MSYVSCNDLPTDVEQAYRVMGKVVANREGKGMMPKGSTHRMRDAAEYNPTNQELWKVLQFVRSTKRKLMVQEYAFWLRLMQRKLRQQFENEEDGTYEIDRRDGVVVATAEEGKEAVEHLNQDWKLVKVTRTVHDDATDQEDTDAGGKQTLQDLVPDKIFECLKGSAAFNSRARPARKSFPLDRLYVWLPIRDRVVPRRFKSCDPLSARMTRKQPAAAPAPAPVAPSRPAPRKAAKQEEDTPYGTLLKTILSSLRLGKKDVTISDFHREATPGSMASRFPELGISAEEYSGWRSKTSEFPGAWAFAAEYLADTQEFASMAKSSKKMSRRQVACSPEIDWMRDDLVKRVNAGRGDLGKWVQAVSVKK